MTIEERFEEAEDLFYDDEYEKAFPLLQALASEGHAPAQYLLGDCYYSGDGVEQDYTKAFEWFSKAADQGDKDGQFMLARCYETGNGVKGDLAKAKELYEKAASQGCESAAKKIAIINGESTPAIEVDEGDIVFAEWSSNDYYLAEVIAASSNGRATVRFYDGNELENVRVGNIYDMIYTHYMEGNTYLNKEGPCEILGMKGAEVIVRFTNTGTTETLSAEYIIFTTPKKSGPRQSSPSTNTGESKKPPVFSIAGAVVLGLIGLIAFKFIGLIIGAVAGWFIGGFVAKKLGKG